MYGPEFQQTMDTDLFQEIGGLVSLNGPVGCSFSVVAETGVAGGNNRFGLASGIPVFVGDLAALPVTLDVICAHG